MRDGDILDIDALSEEAKSFAVVMEKLEDEMRTIIVGQDDILEKLLVAVLAQGHALLEGMPGLAKTLVVKTLAECIRSDFVRLQFTPDLLPADITGTKIYDHATSSFRTIEGPIFSNFVLADEINRAPPKVQSALLEAMQERQVSIQGETHHLRRPFFVMATQNPIESEGTYRLPEAQVDRFMFKLVMPYPSRGDESEIIRRFTEGIEHKANSVLDTQELITMQEFVPRVYADETVREYIADIVDATRNPTAHDLDPATVRTEYGASPRASIWLMLGAKAVAMMSGRGYVIPEDVRKIAPETLRHRILLTYEAEADGSTNDDVIAGILGGIRVP